MLYLVCYDIADHRRLVRVAKVMEGYGERVQESVFECRLGEGAMREMRHAVAREMNPAEDQVRYYPLCGKDAADMVEDGKGAKRHLGGWVAV